MKEGWKMVKLGEVAEIIAGQSPEGKFYNEEGIGTPFYQGKKEFTAKYIGLPTTWTTLESKIAIENDILMSVRAPVGDINFATQRICIGRGLAAIRPYNEINKDYLYYYLIAEKKNIKGKEGAVFPSINRNEIKTIKLPLPPLEEQHRIVSILDASFEKIDALKKNAEENLKNAKALFQQVLVQELKPKEGWVEKKLGEFAYMKAGDFVKASDIHTNPDEGLFPCYGGNGLRGYVSEHNQEGDYCLIGRQGALCGCIHRVSGIYRTTEHAVIVKPYEEIPTTLVYYLLISLDLNKYATGAAQPGLSVKNISENVIISIPPLSEQHRIVRTLDTLSEKCRRLEQVAQQTIRECDALKQSILRKAFSGEL